MIFIHYSAERTKCAFVEITEVTRHLSVMLKDKYFVLPGILSILQHRRNHLKVKVSL